MFTSKKLDEAKDKIEALENTVYGLHDHVNELKEQNKALHKRLQETCQQNNQIEEGIGTFAVRALPVAKMLQQIADAWQVPGEKFPWEKSD